MSPEELAAFIASRIDTEVLGDWDIEARSDGRDTVAVWVEHRTEELGTTFLVSIERSAV